MSPQRIQRKRTKGWRMPEGAIYVGRPSPWRNPFKVGEVYDRVLYSGRTMRGAVDQTVRNRAHMRTSYSTSRTRVMPDALDRSHPHRPRGHRGRRRRVGAAVRW